MTPEEMTFNGNLIPMEEFIEEVRAGNFIDYDGFGYYATVDNENNPVTNCEIIRPSHVMQGWVKKQYTHVIWFNR